MPCRSVIFGLIVCGLLWLVGCSAHAPTPAVDLSSRVKRSDDAIAVNPAELCLPEGDEFRLTAVGKEADGHVRFRFENLGDSPVTLELQRSGEAFRADYPMVRVFFRFPQSEGWHAPVWVPGTFISEGLEIVSVEGGDRLDFSFPIVRYLPTRDVDAIKIQIGVRRGTKNEEASACVPSLEFGLEG